MTDVKPIVIHSERLEGLGGRMTDDKCPVCGKGDIEGHENARGNITVSRVSHFDCVRQLHSHEVQTHAVLSAILGTDTALEDAATRMKRRAERAEADLDELQAEHDDLRVEYKDLDLQYKAALEGLDSWRRKAMWYAEYIMEVNGIGVPDTGGSGECRPRYSRKGTGEGPV